MPQFDPTAAANYGAMAYWARLKLVTNNGYQGINANFIETGAGIFHVRDVDNLGKSQARVINSLGLVDSFKFVYNGNLTENTKFAARNNADVILEAATPAINVDLGKSKVIAQKTGVADLVGSKTGKASLEFVFKPGVVNAINWTYEQGTDLQISKTNTVGSSTSTGGSSALTSEITASGSFLGVGLEAKVSKALVDEWASVKSVDFSNSTTETISKKMSTTYTFDIGGIRENANGKYTYENIELIPDKRYVAEIRATIADVETSISSGIDIYGANFVNVADSGTKGPRSYNLKVGEAIDNALKSQYKSLNPLNNTPINYKYDPNTKVVTVDAVAVGKGQVSIAASTNVSNPTQTPGLTVMVEVNPGNFVAAATTNISGASQSVVSLNAAALDVNLDKVERGQNIGVYLDFSDESLIKQQNINVYGSSSIVGDHVVVADKDHSFVSFKNSIIEAGNGFNNVLIKPDETRNTFTLGGGGDTVSLDGDRNHVDAGAGVNAFIIKGKGTNYLFTGLGADTLKFTSKDSMTYVNDFNVNEDRIEFGGDITAQDAKVTFDQSTLAYSVTVNGKEIAYLKAAVTALPTYDDNLVAQGTKVTPIDLNSKGEAFVGQIYAEAFDRAPEKAGLAYWTSVLNSSQSKLDFIKSVYTSTEFNNAHQSNADFVKELYVDLLGRSADTGGQQGWVNALDGGLSRAAVVDTFIHSPEFVQVVGQPAPAPTPTPEYPV